MEIKKLVSEYLDSNVFIVKNGSVCFIVDSGVATPLVKRDVGDCKVLGILLTHGHYDHAMYALDYAKSFNCKVYASTFAKEELLDPDKNYGESFKLNSFENFVFVTGNGKIELDNFEIEYFDTPGHCKSSLCYLFNGHLFAGDTLFDNGIGRTDLYGSSKIQMISSLEKLDTIEFEICHSGHGNDSDHTRQKRNIKAYLRFLSR